MKPVTKNADEQVIRNREHFNRAVLFEGCSSVGGFTDIDAVYDVKGKALVLIEVKHYGSPITTGQKILFDRLVMWCQKPVYAITAWEYGNGNEDIMLKDAIVKEVRIKDPKTGKSVVKPSKAPVTVRAAIEYIEKKHGVAK
jgi:hypothetical protein